MEGGSQNDISADQELEIQEIDLVIATFKERKEQEKHDFIKKWSNDEVLKFELGTSNTDSLASLLKDIFDEYLSFSVVDLKELDGLEDIQSNLTLQECLEELDGIRLTIITEVNDFISEQKNKNEPSELQYLVESDRRHDQTITTSITLYKILTGDEEQLKEDNFYAVIKRINADILASHQFQIAQNMQQIQQQPKINHQQLGITGVELQQIHDQQFPQQPQINHQQNVTDINLQPIQMHNQQKFQRQSGIRQQQQNGMPIPQLIYQASSSGLDPKTDEVFYGNGQKFYDESPKLNEYDNMHSPNNISQLIQEARGKKSNLLSQSNNMQQPQSRMNQQQPQQNQFQQSQVQQNQNTMVFSSADQKRMKENAAKFQALRNQMQPQQNQFQQSQVQQNQNILSFSSEEQKKINEIAAKFQALKKQMSQQPPLPVNQSQQPQQSQLQQNQENGYQPFKIKYNVPRKGSSYSSQNNIRKQQKKNENNQGGGFGGGM